MHMKFLGLIELIFAIVIGMHLLYNWFSKEIALITISYVFARGIIFTISSKDFASIVDLIFGVYAILAVYGVFSHFTVTIALIVWFAQKALFSLALGH